MRSIILVLVLGLSCLSCSIQKDIELYVSKENTGNQDNATGNKFSTIHEAIEKAGKLRASGNDQHIAIKISPGEYYLTKPISIGVSLSNLTIEGTSLSEVRIKGSKPLQLTWDKWDENIYVAKLDQQTNFDQFLVDGKPQILARYPNYDESAHYWNGSASDAIAVERVKSWKQPEGAIFHALHKGRWGGFHFEITGVNDDGTPILEGGHQNNRPNASHLEYRMVENVFEELDSPGEWYFDEAKNLLYYYPLENVDLSTAAFEVAILQKLIHIEGSLDEPVRNVHIKNITFENTQRTLMEEYEPLLRSDWTIYRGAALFLEGTESCSISNCEFTNLGGNVIMASKYTKGLKVSGNHIHDCGASAISFVGDVSAVRSPSLTYREFVDIDNMDTVPGPQGELYPRDCIVDDNLIHRIGRIEKQTAGVQIAMAMDITVSNNSIYDVPRAGINIGDGTWGGHVLEYNDVFNTVLETSDHGSFNSWGRDRFWHPNRGVMDSLTSANPDMPKWDAINTTVIRNNRFRCDHGWDIDLDDGSSNYHIYNNLCLNRGVKLREGFNRVVENNIMVNSSLHPHVWFEQSEDVFKHNIVSDAYQDVRVNGWGKELDYNLFPNEAALLKSQIYDRDLNSLFGDPQFRNPSELDFSVEGDSPAFEIGFKNFPMNEFGVKSPDLKKLAKTPEVPELKTSDSADSQISSTIAWLRVNLKNVDSQEEQSAYGLNTREGVIVTSAGRNSPAVKNNGLRKGDVILSVGGKQIKSVIEFLKVNKEYISQGSMEVTVMRNQKTEKLSINIK